MTEASRTIKAAGDTWSARLGEEMPRPGVRAILFFCTTTNQRPYRVVEVPVERLAGREDLESIDDDALSELFEASGSMGVPQEYE